MSRLFYHVMQDNLGNLLFDVSGTMRLAGTGTVATIYGDEAATVILPNPMTNHPSYGSFKCFLKPGNYDFYMAKAGYSFETLTGIPGYGSMAQQYASAVAITGGSATFTSLTQITGTSDLHHLIVNAPESSTQDIVTTLLRVVKIGVQQNCRVDAAVGIQYDRALQWGLIVTPSADSGAGSAAMFQNASGASIGSITTTGAATAYNTTSDGRLKEAIEPLCGALDIVRALNPVSFLWKADGAPGRGFVAQEVAEVVDGVITGEADAVDEHGQIVPQMIDYSKLVPYLIGAVKELTQQVEMLTAQLAAAGA